MTVVRALDGEVAKELANESFPSIVWARIHPAIDVYLMVFLLPGHVDLEDDIIRVTSIGTAQ